MDYQYKDIKVKLKNPQNIYAELACIFWINQSIVLQQLHYWLTNNHERNIREWTETNVYEWRIWSFNTYKKWKTEDFPRWSERTIQRIFEDLVSVWVIVVGNYNKKWYDNTNWYTIEYDVFESMIHSWEKMPYLVKSKTSKQLTTTTWLSHHDNLTWPIPETTEETTKKILYKYNTPNGDESVEKEKPIINNIANNKEEIQLDTNVHTTVQATLPDHRAKLDNFFKEDITDEQFEEEAATERWMWTLWEKWYEDEYEHVEKAIEQVTAKKELTKQYWRSDINKICHEFQNLCEEYWLVYSNKDDRKAAKRLTWKPFWLKIAVTWCEDLFCYMKQIFEWNSTLWSYWYSIGWPAPFFYNAEKVYNKLKMSGKRESSTNPRFEEFYAIYPKREWYSEAKERYSINVRKKEKHDEIMQWAKEFVKKVWKEQKDITFLPSANTYLVKERWYDTLPDKLQDDDVVYQRAYESWDPEILREHLKLKYWEDFSKREELDHVCIYWQEKKTAIECKNQTPII